MMGYTLKAFGEYKEGYSKYLAELQKVDTEVKNNKGNKELNHNLIRYRQQIDEKYKKYLSFSGFGLWKQFSGKENLPDDKVKEIFCKETIYVMLNKLLFIRICEDKELLLKNISNGGIEVLRKHFADTEDAYKEILNVAYRNAKKFYTHFYEPGILDWYMEGDSELNEILNKVLWILNQFDFTHVDRDILGNLYEKYLPGNERKRLGEFYTPVEVIDYILTSVGYTYSYDLETKDLLDPACGSGGFIVRATRRLISRYLIKFNKAEKRELRDPKNWQEIVNRLSPSEAKIILEAIQEHIYGLDINPFACHIAEMNMLFQVIDLYKKAREHFKDYKLGKFKIYRTDSLELAKDQRQIFDFTHKEFLEEQDEINDIKRKKFDFVVGNPPYVRVQMLDEKIKEHLINSYASATGIFDLYVVFIERGFNWLKSKGKFGYIVSNKFMQSSYGVGIRKFIVKNISINQLIDFGDSGVFTDVTNYPLIFVGTNRISVDNRFTFIKVLNSKNQKEIMEEIWNNFNKDYYKSDSLEIFEIEQPTLSENPWTFSNPAVMKIMNKIEKISKGYFIRNFARPHRCLYTGLNEAYVVDEKLIKGGRLETELIKKVIGGRNIYRWNITWRNEFIIYPYQKINGELKPVSLSGYPNIKRYLEQFKDKLMDRWFIKKIKKEEREARWFEYADPRNIDQFERLKIITPDISTNNRFALDFDGLYSLNTSYVIDLGKFTQDPKYLLGLLNSSTLEFYFKQISPFISGRYHRYINQYLEKLPIKLPETSDEKKLANQIIKKVDEILELNKLGIVDIDAILEGEETEKICNLPKISFSIKDEAKFEKTKVKDDQIYINSQDFIEVKDKKVREYVEIYLNCNSDKISKSKDVKNMILNIPVPKSDEIIKEIIKKCSVDYTKNKGKIQKLEEEIDTLIYELYGLNKKEIAIVEESLKG